MAKWLRCPKCNGRIGKWDLEELGMCSKCEHEIYEGWVHEEVLNSGYWDD